MNWEHRDRKLRKKRYGMRVSGRSLKTVILPTIAKKAKEAKQRERDHRPRHDIGRRETNGN